MEKQMADEIPAPGKDLVIDISKNKIHVLFLVCCAGVVLLNLGFFRQLLDYSTKHEFASDVFLIPMISAFLIFRKKDKIFAETHVSPGIGIPVCIAAIIAIFATSILTIKTLAIVALFLGLFLVFYGMETFRKALFPLLFLVLMAPVPESFVQQIAVVLQKGSAEIVAILFGVTGTPFHRENLTFILPKIAIEIATQCSGIRSSIALLLSCLLAAHMILSKFSRQIAFVLLAIPMAMFKNAVRIATLSLLAIHVDVGFVGGSDLHRKGGIVFFVTTLLFMAPILWLLKRSEKA
jgi:exosortase